MKLKNNLYKDESKYKLSKPRKRKYTEDAVYLKEVIKHTRNNIKEVFSVSEYRAKVLNNLQGLIDCFEKQEKRNDELGIYPSFEDNQRLEFNTEEVIFKQTDIFNEIYVELTAEEEDLVFNFQGNNS